MSDGLDLFALTMPQILAHRARTQGAALALREKDQGLWRRTTWGHYFERVRHFAVGLLALGFRPGERLAIASDDSPEWFIADLAAQMAGGACLGIYPTNPWPELHYILRHSKARLVVCGDQEQTDKVLAARIESRGLPDLQKIICVDMKGMRHYDRAGLLSFAEVEALGQSEQARLGAEADRLLGAGRPDDVAIIVYTSGTTGMPKGAKLSHRNMLASASQVVGALGLNAETYSVLCYLPLCHVAERSFSMVMQLVTGCTVNFAESVDTVVVNLREISPKGFLGVPRIWEKMQQSVVNRSKDATRFQQAFLAHCLRLGRPIAERRMNNGGAFTRLCDRLAYFVLWAVCFRALKRFLGLDRVKNSFCGGAPVSPEVLLFFWILGVPLYQIYGMTESGGVSHMQQPGATLGGCSGRAIAGLEQKLADDGELLLRGPSIFLGYLFDEEASARALAGGWLHTGDIVEFDDSGELRVHDRKKDILITSGGKNITPSLIENALRDSPYIREAILLGDGRNFLAALIQVDFEATGKWAQARGLAYTTYRTLAENDAVRDLVAGEVKRVNDRFARVENIRKFLILSKELDHDDGEMTATMKVRRRIIEEKFKDEIANIYGGAA